MVFILPVMVVGQGPVVTQPPSIETRAPQAEVATGAPFAGWRLVAQALCTPAGTSWQYRRDRLVEGIA